MIDILNESNSDEKLFVRFGKRLKHGKSMNYLALSDRIKDIYSNKLAELQYGHISEDEFNEWCEKYLEPFVWESNISCFDCDPKTKLPIVINGSQCKTLIGFIRRLECDLPCDTFLVKGKQVGVGTDKEPLVDVTYEEPIEYDIDDLIDVAIDGLEKGFEVTDISEDHYEDELTYIGGSAFVYKDRLFIYPKKSYFDALVNYSGPVLNKLKNELKVDIDYDNLECIFISAEENGGREELEDIIYNWGESIYSKPSMFEEDDYLGIQISGDDIYVCGMEDNLNDFVDKYWIEYELCDIPDKLLQKYKKMKFYR